MSGRGLFLAGAALLPFVTESQPPSAAALGSFLVALGRQAARTFGAILRMAAS